MEECRAETVALYCQCVAQNISLLGNDYQLQWRTIPLSSIGVGILPCLL